MSLLGSVSVPWWIAGGWAIDLFLGRVSRAHDDLDIGVLYRDSREVLDALADWEIFEAHGGELTLLERGSMPRTEVHSLWCRPSAAASWALEIMLDAADGADWVYRREPKIRRALGTITHSSPGRPRYLAPEIQLLYKSKRPRRKDHADFDQAVPELSATAMQWLRGALALIEPEHVWLARLAV